MEIRTQDFFTLMQMPERRVIMLCNLKRMEVMSFLNMTEMCEVIQIYFTAVFGKDVVEHELEDAGNIAVISETQNAALVEDFTIEESSTAIKQMHPDEASGSDGLNPAFFQHFWSLMGPKIFQRCKNWLQECSFPANLNDINVVLISKKENADSMKDLRPITLCNVSYKIIAKVLANRLKVILPRIITEDKSAFVPGRNITDSVLLRSKFYTT